MVESVEEFAPEAESAMAPEEAAVAKDESAPLGGAMAAWGGRLGVDLDDVKVHQGGEAHARAEQHGARALAEGSDIYLGRGESADDPQLMGHEVAHVAQAKKGLAAGPHG